MLKVQEESHANSRKMANRLFVLGADEEDDNRAMRAQRLQRRDSETRSEWLERLEEQGETTSDLESEDGYSLNSDGSDNSETYPTMDVEESQSVAESEHEEEFWERENEWISNQVTAGTWVQTDSSQESDTDEVLVKTQEELDEELEEEEALRKHQLEAERLEYRLEAEADS